MAPLVGCLLLLGTASHATPMPTLNGATQIQFTAFGALTNLGVNIIPGGTAEVFAPSSLPSPFIFYDVTAVDAMTTEIFHAGSVLDFEKGGTTVSFKDFIINETQGLVYADVMSPDVNGVNAVFEVGGVCSVASPCLGLDGTTTVDGGLELLLTNAGADILKQLGGIPDLMGVAIGVANTTFTVPEPGIALFGLMALAGLGVQRRRTRS
jgi:MYXO-CTERM domain-containing protein